jgi:hypothetical protein
MCRAGAMELPYVPALSIYENSGGIIKTRRRMNG